MVIPLRRGSVLYEAATVGSSPFVKTGALGFNAPFTTSCRFCAQNRITLRPGAYRRVQIANRMLSGFVLEGVSRASVRCSSGQRLASGSGLCYVEESLPLVGHYICNAAEIHR